MNCKDGTLEMTETILRLLQKIDDQTYCKNLTVFNGSTLGHHFRHILDFYNCLIFGVENGLIDYSERERNVLIQEQTKTAYLAFQRINASIVNMNDQNEIQVKADFSGEDRPLVQSTIGRELMFTFDHAIHHLAMIKIGLQTHFPNIEIDDDLGLAPSTIKNQNGEKAPINCSQ